MWPICTLSITRVKHMAGGAPRCIMMYKILFWLIWMCQLWSAITFLLESQFFSFFHTLFMIIMNSFWESFKLLLIRDYEIWENMYFDEFHIFGKNGKKSWFLPKFMMKSSQNPKHVVPSCRKFNFLSYDTTHIVILYSIQTL